MNFHSLANESGGSTKYTHYPAKVTFKILRVRGAAGWLRWIKTVFERGKINEIWKNIELKKWFDPAFQDFVDRELSHAIRK